MRVLVTGGAGYVGSHMVDMLIERGAEVTVVDDLRQGHPATLPDAAELVVADVTGFRRNGHGCWPGGDWHAIIHFAALSIVAESMERPMRYMRENAAGGFALIDVALRNKVPRFVFSSTASVFGEPAAVPIEDDAQVHPTSPYGESKLMIERALYWASEQHGLTHGEPPLFQCGRRRSQGAARGGS